MRALGDADLLMLWERGATLHPLDRALLLCAWVRDDLEPTRLADLPLGLVTTSLIRLRRESFGPRIAARIDCECCGERLEITLDADTLADAAGEPDPDREAVFDGFRFRAPTMRDLTAVADGREDAALSLLERCCISRPEGAAQPLEALLDEVERHLEALDPLADLQLAVTCETCGHAWAAGLDFGALVWEEIAGRATALLGDVHRLALAYGWSEREILALSPQRRAAYLELGAM